jgi:acyl dehydratase
MSSSGEPEKGLARVLYWEDLVDAPVRRYGPLVFSSQLLDQLLELMGERHPIHDSDAFAQSTSRKQRIVPGGFIHSITSGWVVKHSVPVAVVGLRSVTWDFVRPLYPDKPFFFTNRTTRSAEIDRRLGLIDTERRVFDEMDQVHALGRMNVVMLRRPAHASNVSNDRPTAVGGSNEDEGLLRGI